MQPSRQLQLSLRLLMRKLNRQADYDEIRPLLSKIVSRYYEHEMNYTLEAALNEQARQTTLAR